MLSLSCTRTGGILAIFYALLLASGFVDLNLQRFSVNKLTISKRKNMTDVGRH